MQRLLRLSSLMLLLALFAYEGKAQIAELTGRVAPGEVRVLLKDSLYRISGTYMIGGTLIIEPGTVVEFTDNSRLVDSTGGRIIADGRMSATYSGTNFSNVVVNNPPSNRPYGYADPAYFLAPGVISYNTPTEITVDPTKDNFVYNVLLDTTVVAPQVGGTGNSRNRVLRNFQSTTGTSYPAPAASTNRFVIRPEAAIIYEAARLRFANSDPNVNILPFRRLGTNRSVNITQQRIVFRGRPVNAFSREWGHVVVLPGARTAFFRDVDFQNFRKDTTVDNPRAINGRYYNAVAGETATQTTNRNNANAALSDRSSGGGGAITTFSSRTWIIGCVFSNNFARYRGGALQILETPATSGFYPTPDLSTIPFYPANLNSGLTNNSNGQPASVNINSIRAIDVIYTANGGAEPLSDANRQAVDDGRLAVFLGRVREDRFNNNTVQLAAFGQFLQGGVLVTGDRTDVDAPVNTSSTRRNEAFGGALFIGGESRNIEVGFGVNDVINGVGTGLKDYVEFTNNSAVNYQRATLSNGARGGAVYVGAFTSVTFGGRFADNRTSVPRIILANRDVPNLGENSGNFSAGGAIYAAFNAGRIQVRGGQDQRASYPTHFIRNTSGRGGAIAVTNLSISTDTRLSPVVGGSDTLISVRNFGYNIVFDRNTATFDGGAIFTQRNMTVYGAGGVVGNTLLGYALPYRVNFSDNSARFSGGAISIHLDTTATPLTRRYVQIVRTVMSGNSVGASIDTTGLSAAELATTQAAVRGGGAVYALNANLNVVKGAEFVSNRAVFGNGGAIAIISPATDSKRFFVTDVDGVAIASATAEAQAYTSTDVVFTNPQMSPFPPDARMLTRFLDNEAVENAAQMGSGATQAGNVSRTHPGTAVAENGTGLGGALYILDNANINRIGRADSVFFNRVRIVNNRAYTGAAVYSDNYDLKIALQRSLIAANTANSQIGAQQNAIFGPFVNNGSQSINPASSDLAGAVLYGEIVGPLPFESFSNAANSIYDNTARFLIRLPDAPNTKGVLAVGSIGSGGVDTLRGNYWGRTEANVTTVLPSGTLQETFFVAGNGETHLRFDKVGQYTDPKQQGPFESITRYSYVPVPVANASATDQNTPAATSIPEQLLMQGKIYDLFDKGTDIKTADYSRRRMSPIEDFAVGIPPRVRRYTEAAFTGQPSFGRYVRRIARNPLDVDAGDATLNRLQTEYRGDHPIGYPLFLESRMDYTGAAELSNQDHPNAPYFNESVFFVINETTGDFIRVNMRQVTTSSELFRARIEILPDSATRSGNPTSRRSEEQLANFGSGQALLTALYQNSFNEDASALQGRRYQERTNNFAVTFANRPAMPASNQDTVNFWAGERYRALPANAGDLIRVVSRTVLWNEGVDAAYNSALVFNIGTSTQPPVLTGNTLTLQNQLPVELRNMVFVSEDRAYPRDITIGDRPAGRDSIFAFTAIDSNLFYDPRAYLFPGEFAQLTYTWNVDQGSGLSYWLSADTVRFDPNNVQTRYGAGGYLVFRGRPTNPFVVPGGEVVRVGVANYSATSRTVDSLRATLTSRGFTPDSINAIIARYIYLYPPYFHAERYDGANARFLQQDTINFGTNAITSYQFRVFVTDTAPTFTASVATCGTDEMFVANLTDSLRFKLDLNTDDEAEDAAAALQGWDFRYGRTAYGFKSIAIRNNPSDTSISEVLQVRPRWMSPQYMKRFNNSGLNDNFASDFTQNGQVNIRIAAAEARNLLLPVNQFSNALNTDTMVTFAVNDGHGGLNYLTRRVMVNVAPTITNNALSTAVEDLDYNTGLLDSTRMITVSDPNFGQAMRYELIYTDDTRDAVAKDICFTEAGQWGLAGVKTTPAWLKIDPISGLLFGTPRVTDVPRRDTTVQVTVLVTDAGGLTHLKQLPLQIRHTNHPPRLTLTPTVRCVELGKPYSDTITVTDIDLVREETVTLRVLSPSGFSVIPQNITGPLANNSRKVAIATTNFSGTRDADGKVTITIEATDPEGGRDVISYRVNVSEPTRFTTDIRVTNLRGAFQVLTFGTADVGATTGEEPGNIGRLDAQYCEYELPPIPPTDVFDARWAVSNTNGIIRNIFPTGRLSEVGRQLIYKGRFQAGALPGGGNNYPVYIGWKKSSVPAKTDGTRNPSGATWFIKDASSNGGQFTFNMNTGAGFAAAGIRLEEFGGNPDSVTLVIERVNIQDFIILYDVTSDVNSDVVAGYTNSFELKQNVPNPFTTETSMNFVVPTDAQVAIEVFDAMGAKVATLANGFYPQGTYTATWNATNSNGQAAPSGMYIVRLTSGNTTVNRNIILVH